MHDPTVSAVPCERAQWAISIPVSHPERHYCDDELLSLLLITRWTLLTGRNLRSDVPPQMLTAEELINFWADDQMDAST
jgi:hypothetical protein